MKRPKPIFRDDEFYLVQRAGKFYMFGMLDGRRVRMSCGTRDLAKAKVFLENKKRELTGGWREDYDSSGKDWREIAIAMNDRHKRSAIKRGIPFELTPGGIYALMKSTGFRCAISGIEFAKRSTSNGKRDPWAPSIDRIENRQGYTVENVRVVCLVANIAMQDWGFDVLLRLSRGIHRSSLTLAEELTPNETAGSSKDNNILKYITK